MQIKLALALITLTAVAHAVEPFSADETPAEQIVPHPKAPRDSDSGAAPETRYLLAPGLTFGAKAEIEAEMRQNFDLDDTTADDFTVLGPQLSLAFSYDPAPWIQAFVNFELSQDFITDDEEFSRIPDDDTHLAARDAFIRLIAPWGVSLQVGRQRFKDSREWLFDERLDAMRLVWQRGDLTVDASVSRQNLGDEDFLQDSTDTEEFDNWLLHVRYDFHRKLHAAAYALYRDDRTVDAESPVFYGVHLDGEVANDLEVWLEAAHVRGEDGNDKIRGWGFDLGATYEFDYDIKPSITFGYAFGSGDNDSTGDVDESFRQTGLQDNAAKYNGVTRLKYYGEVFNPELSNLSVITAGVGIRPTPRSSIDLVYHQYFQHHLEARRTSDADIRIPANGLDRELGGELDLVAGYREIKDLDIELTVGYFFPGRGFGTGADGAFLGGMKVRHEF